ncbi:MULTISPECIES: hypothetical protein [unclassified Clostridium]|uniref:hypothetical protein n=1 Tax=unclassified Clostridium TaxID=2614128 RepID=UPI00207954A8|nr:MULTISPECIES: hypothetical protein [unclassified Clostridium]
MLGLIVNEKEVCEKALYKKIIDKKPMKVIRLIIKKYLSEGLSKEEIYIKVSDFLEEIYKDKFNKSYWKKVVDGAIGTVSKYNNYNLVDIEKIEIYKEELENIEALNDIKLEKLAFILLVYAKINKIINPLSDGRINIKLSCIFKESILSVNKEKILLHKLVELKYLLTNTTCDSTTIKINYMKNDGDVSLIVENLKDLNAITYYLEYRLNYKYKMCEVKNCRERFKLKSPNSPQTYCNKCAKKIELEKHRERNKKWYKNSISDGK